MRFQILRSSRDADAPADKRLPRWFAGWFEERYGDHCVQISVESTLKLRAAVRDVSRASRGHVPEDIEGWCRRFEEPPQGLSDLKHVVGYDSDEGYVQGSIERDEALQAYANRYPGDWDVVKKCLGLARSRSRHACARVISNRPVHEFIPLTTVSGVRVTQFTAPSVEAVGGLKMDFLTVNSLGDIQDAIKLIQQRSGLVFAETYINGRRVPAHRLVPLLDGSSADIWDLPPDQAVFKDVAEGRTETVFQFNTHGARQWLTYFDYDRPDGTKAIDSIESMAAFTALDRKGPLDVLIQDPENPNQKHNMLVEYARRARGAVGSQDILPVLEQLVPETYGVMCYQESLQRVYQHLTGCTATEAEEFRTNVAKKKKEKVDAAYRPFMERASLVIGEENAKKLWDAMRTWAQYGFNFAHAVCYAVIAYACAYLKHHYPLEWWCSVLKNATKDDINSIFWEHVGHAILLPDLQLSGANWQIEGDRIRAPLSLLHGVGEKAHQQLVAGAPYTSLLDLAQKTKAYRESNKVKKQVKVKGTEDQYTEVWAMGRSAVHRGIVHTLIVSGALDTLLPSGVLIQEALDLYDQAMEEVFGRSKSKKKVYPTLDPLGRYQSRKQILPAYGCDLRGTIEHAGPLHLQQSGVLRYKHLRWDRRRREEVPTNDPVVDYQSLRKMAAADPPEDGWRCGVIAYVEAARLFRYPKETRNKEALELTLEIGGGRYSAVHWPDKDGRLPENVRNVEAGSIAAVLLERWSAGKPFGAKHLHVLRKPLEKAEDGDDTETQ